MAREKFQRKRYFSMKRIVGSTLKLSAKVIFLIGQVPIKKYGLKTLFLLLNT